MKASSLRQRLLKYLLSSHGWVHSGDLQRQVVKYTDYMPRTAVRRLEEMVEDGELEVRYEKGSALYRAKDGTAAPKLPNPNHIQGVGTLKDYTHFNFAA